MAARESTAKSESAQEFREVMRRDIADRWAELWKEMPEAIKGKDMESVHKVRVASRRLRAAMDIATDCFPAKSYRPLHKTAKRITKALGEVRDRDVLLEALTKKRESASEAEQKAIDYLVERIESDRKQARKSMVRFFRKLEKQGVRKRTRRQFRAKGDQA